MPFRSLVRNFQAVPSIDPLSGQAIKASSNVNPQWQYIRIDPGMPAPCVALQLPFGVPQVRDDAIEIQLIQGMPGGVLPLGMNVFVKSVQVDAGEEFLHSRSLYFVAATAAEMNMGGPPINYNAMAVANGSDPHSNLSTNVEAARLRQRIQNVWTAINALPRNSLAIVGSAFLSRNFTVK